MGRLIYVSIGALCLVIASAVWAQEAGTSCTAGQNGYTGSADKNGNITKCNGTTWNVIWGPSNTTVIASGTTGSLQYNSGGLLAGDSNIWWDKINIRLGVGTNMPSATLQVTTGSKSISLNTNANSYGSTDALLQISSTSVANWARFGTSGSPLAIMTNGGDASLVTPAIFVTSANMIGISTSVPAYRLDVNGQSRIQTPGQSYYTVLTGNEVFVRNSPLYLNSSSTSNTLINISGGNVGIGTAVPSNTLTVAATGGGVYNYLSLGPGYNADPTLRFDTGAAGTYSRIESGGYISFYAQGTRGANATPQMFVASTGVSIGSASPAQYPLDVTGNGRFTGTVTQNSDARLKSNIQQLPADVFEKLALIRGVTFNWKDRGRDPGQQLGVIAQDVQKAYPQLVTADASGTLSVNYSGLVAPLIEAVKQIKAENVDLRKELDADRKSAALDHDLLFKIRHHIALRNSEQTPYTESAWRYAAEDYKR